MDAIDWQQRAVDAEEALREWVEADQDLRAHPPNVTTKRWEQKRERVERARDVAQAVLQAAPKESLVERILSAIEAEQRAPQNSGPENSNLRFGLGVAHVIIRREWNAYRGK